jgi:hypothetical protein
LIRSAVELTFEQGREGGKDLRRIPAERPSRYEAIDSALKQSAEARPRSHEEVFRHLDERNKHLPNAEPFRSARGWLAGFQKNPARARVWLSKRWSLLKLPGFTSGPK